VNSYYQLAERGRKVIFVQPTKKLIAENVDHTFKVQGVDPSIVTKISERTCPDGASMPDGWSRGRRARR